MWDSLGSPAVFYCFISAIRRSFFRASTSVLSLSSYTISLSTAEEIMAETASSSYVQPMPTTVAGHPYV